MGRPPALPVDDKVEIVLAVLGKELTMAQAARRYEVTEQSISRWKSQFIAGGRVGLEFGSHPVRGSPREQELLAENTQLRTALGEALVEARVWRMSAESRLGPTPTSR